MQPRSGQPWSSLTMSRMFGRSAANETLRHVEHEDSKAKNSGSSCPLIAILLAWVLRAVVINFAPFCPGENDGDRISSGNHAYAEGRPMPQLRLILGILAMGLLTRNLAAEDEAV